MIDAAQALRLIASAPGAGEKTTADLRGTAIDIEHEAERRERIAISRMGQKGNRARARTARAAADARKLLGHASLCRAAADEVERRKCATVGEAVRHPLVRAARRFVRRDRMDAGKAE